MEPWLSDANGQRPVTTMPKTLVVRSDPIHR